MTAPATDVTALGRGRLVVSCSDRPGIVAAVSRFLFEKGANVVLSDQHTTDPAAGTFVLRVEFNLPELADRAPALRTEIATIGDRYGMAWRLARAATRQRLALFVSKEDHCLLELLWQRRAGDLAAEIALVIGNHAYLTAVVAPWGVPFAHVPVTPASRGDAEARQLALLDEAAIDLVVLARCMRILSPGFVARWRHRIVNILHGLLPAFVGANPYAQARASGVKLIDASAHYVTADLDDGSIIEQDVRRVDHRHETADLRRIGRQIERGVLVRAVAWHVEDRVLVYGERTVVFA